jgi:hypothetical protein
MSTLPAELTVLKLLEDYRELTTRQLKSKTGFTGNHLDECLRMLKESGQIFSTTDPISGVTHWHLNRAEPNPARPDSPAAKVCTPTTPENLTMTEKAVNPLAQPRKPYTPNRVNGFYRHRGNIVIKLDRRASAHSVTLSPADLSMITSLMREDAP